MNAKRNLTDKQVAILTKTSARTVRNYRRLYGISNEYTAISDAHLDRLVRKFKRSRPGAGIRYVVGYLRSRSIKVLRRRVLESIARVDGIGQALRRHEHIVRRPYKSLRPNYMWHCDGHHKLIRWGIVIHGFIDGYCRTVSSTSIFFQMYAQWKQVIGIQASNNNRARTVARLFIRSVRRYGIPSRVRGDRGGENLDVAALIVLLRGDKRGSFIWGS